MTMDYNEDFALRALNQLAKPDGQPLFEHASEALRLLYTFDVQNYVHACTSRDRASLKKLFISSEPESIETLKLASGTEAPFGGEWFVNTVIGKNVTLSAGSKLLAHGGITLGDDCVVGEQAQIVTVGHPMHPRQRHLILIGPIEIGEKALVGGGAILLNTGSADPVVVGQHSIVLPGAIISKSVPPFCVSGGVNKVLLEGREYFNDHVSSTSKLSQRLTAEGLAVLQDNVASAGLSLPDDLCAKTQREIPDDTTIITHKETADLNKLSAVFPAASQDVLRFALFFPPIYRRGKGNIVLGNNILINTGSMLTVDGEFQFGDGSFLAPETEVTIPKGSTLILGKKVWIGAKVKIDVPEGETLTIGDGSVVAAGSEIKASIPAMSVVVGAGKIVDTLGEKNIFPIPSVLNDFEVYETQRVRLREHIAKMTPDQVERRLFELLSLPVMPDNILSRGKNAGVKKNLSLNNHP